MEGNVEGKIKEREEDGEGSGRMTLKVGLERIWLRQDGLLIIIALDRKGHRTCAWVATRKDLAREPNGLAGAVR